MSQLTVVSSGVTPGTGVQTITGNTGGAVPPNGSGNINVVGDGTTITDVGNPGTNTITISLLTPVTIPHGGTNATSFTNTDGVVYFDGTRLVDTTAGTSGQVLTSNGAGMAPSFQTLGTASITLTGDTGLATGSTIAIKADDAINNCGSTVNFTASNGPALVLLNVTDGSENTIIGNSAGNASISGTFNTALGQSAASSLTSGSDNIAVGADALLSETTGSNNVAVGSGSLIDTVGQSNNVGVGFQAFGSLTAGSTNVGIGSSVGSQYTTTESSNILLNSPGVTGDSNTLRIGSGSGSGTADLDTVYIYGVNGNTVSSPVMVVLDSSTERWGTQAVPASGIITIDGDTGSVTGTTVKIYTGNPSANGTPSFNPISGTDLRLTFSDNDDNTIIGIGAGPLVTAAGGSFNIGLGDSTFQNLTTGSDNVAVGFSALTSSTADSGNVAVGHIALATLNGGSNNIGVGYEAGNSLTTGSNNVIIGTSAGSTYNGSESNNVLINSGGIISDNNVMRIGSGTGTGTQQLNKAFMSGINGNTVSSALMVTIDSATDQLGTATIPASGITTIDGNSGFATGSTITLTTGAANANGTALFTGNNVSTITMTFTDANANLGLGVNALAAVGTANDNIMLGNGAGSAITTGASFNIGIGSQALQASQFDTNNVAIGFNAGIVVNGGVENVLLGSSTGSLLTTGTDNTILGFSAGIALVTGSYNTMIGVGAGENYTGSESSNVLLGSFGTTGDNNVMRLGQTGTGAAQQSSCYLGGVEGATVLGTNGQVMLLDSSLEQVTALPNSTSGYVLTSTGATTSPIWQVHSASAITITGDSGGGLTGSSFTFTGGTTGLTFAGAGSTETLGGTLVVSNGGTGRSSLTNHSLIVGAGTSPVTQLGVATNGQLPIGSAGADPVLATITAGTGISVTNGAGSITIAATGTTTLTYTNVNSSPYVVLTTDEYLSVDSSGGAITLEFPNAATLSRAWIVKDRTGSAATNNITVTTVGGAVNIDGSTSFVMNTAYESINIIGNGSTYEIY